MVSMTMDHTVSEHEESSIDDGELTMSNTDNNEYQCELYEHEDSFNATIDILIDMEKLQMVDTSKHCYDKSGWDINHDDNARDKEKENIGRDGKDRNKITYAKKCEVDENEEDLALSDVSTKATEEDVEIPSGNT